MFTGYNTVADPGFSWGRGANSQSGRANLFFCNFFCRKLYENERIWTGRGRTSMAPPWIRHWNRSSYLKHVAFVSASVAGLSSLISGHFRPVPRGSCTIRRVRTIVSRDCPVTNDLFCTVQFDQPDTKQLRGSIHRLQSFGLSMWAQYL